MRGGRGAEGGLGGGVRGGVCGVGEDGRGGSGVICIDAWIEEYVMWEKGLLYIHTIPPHTPPPLYPPPQSTLPPFLIHKNPRSKHSTTPPPIFRVRECECE